MRAAAGAPGSRTAHVRALVNTLRVRELQLVLADLNLARSGRKQELIERIVQSLEQMETKANDNASNHATSAYYNDQLNLGLRSLQTHAHAARMPVPTPAYPPPGSAGPSSVAIPNPPPARIGRPLPMPPNLPGSQPAGGYGRPIPYNGHTHPHQRPQQNHHLVPPPPANASQSASYELLRAATPASLNGARCFCGSEAASGKVIPCLECGMRVHAKCHQLVGLPTEDWYCERCRAELCDPFLRVKKTVLAPEFVKFHRNQAMFRIEYSVTDQDINDLYSKREPTPGTMAAGFLELQLRCFIVKEELGTGTSWPTTSIVAANGFSLPLVQRAPPGQSNPSKVLREQPANLFPYSRVGRNTIEVRTGENPMVFCFMVQIVEFRNVNDIINEVCAASESITYEQAKNEVIKSFGSDDDDEDAVVATSTILSVRCPLGLCVIDLPARGVHCKHLQCFDLKTFLMFNKKARSRHYRCTVCHNFIRASDLRIDPYFKKLLREVQGDEDLEEVEIMPDATWKRRVDDEPETPLQKRVKVEATENGAPAVITAAGQTAAAAAGPGTANAPFEIDLLSSDDEDGEALNAVPTLSVNASTTATANGPDSTTSLSDDDVAIFTVDSDVWEMPPANGTSSGSEGFPLDMFSSFGSTNGGAHVDLANGNWTTSGAASYSALPSLTVASTTSTALPAWAASSGSSTGVVATASSIGANRGAETALAAAMAQLSRNHPQVINPFDSRRTPLPKPASGGGGSSGGGGGGPDIIDLLDSDTE